jgi:hypothetical protein
VCIIMQNEAKLLLIVMMFFTIGICSYPKILMFEGFHYEQKPLILHQVGAMFQEKAGEGEKLHQFFLYDVSKCKMVRMGRFFVQLFHLLSPIINSLFKKIFSYMDSDTRLDFALVT